MATLRDIKRKIDAVKEDLADHQGHEHGGRVQASRRPAEHGEVPPYALKFNEVIGRLAAGVEDGESVLDCSHPRKKSRRLSCLSSLRTEVFAAVSITT